MPIRSDTSPVKQQNSRIMDKQSSILVTGGTGFIGSYLLRYLLHSGYINIKATKRPGSRTDLIEDIKDSIQWLDVDVLDIIGIEEAMGGVDYVYHCAAMVSILPSDGQKMIFTNREGTANVVNAALASGIKKMIHVSSIAAVGYAKNVPAHTEKNPWDRNRKVSNYAISKYLAEQEAWRGWAEGLNLAVVNPSVVLGSGRWAEGALALFGVCWNQMAFYPTGVMGYVDVRDVARFMVNLMESSISGERYILSTKSASYQHVQTMIAQTMGKQAPYIKISPGMIKVGAFFEGLRARLMNKAPLITKDVALYANNALDFSNEKSVRDLSFEYTPLDKTIQDAVEAFAASDYGKFTGRPLAY